MPALCRALSQRSSARRTGADYHRLNELLARLEESFERERRFSSAVAHEFRTPVAELRSLAELAIKLPDTRGAQTDHDVLSIALHLESVLTRLLTLDAGSMAICCRNGNTSCWPPWSMRCAGAFKARRAIVN